MKTFDLIVIGFGKAGKTLAVSAAKQNKTVAIIEESEKMYGGTCINVGCIPTKILIHDANVGKTFEQAITRKRNVTAALNQKNFNMLAQYQNIKIYTQHAKFLSNQEVGLYNQNGDLTDILSGTNILINTGSTTIIPNISGLHQSKRVYTSTSIMELDTLPQKLVIIGGGYISLEFASMFARFGTQVTVLEKNQHLLAREDETVAKAVIQDLEAQGITFVLNTEVIEIADSKNHTVVKTSQGDFEADAILIAIGRKANTENLGLENTDIALNQRGEIITDEHLRTSVENIFAAGDVKGGLQFTYISLDDFRIIQDTLYGKAMRTTNNRGAIPYTVFITPPLSRVGLTAKQALEQGYEIIEKQVSVNTMPRHKIDDDMRGMFKIVVDKKTRTLLGATLYARQSEELINLLKLAIDSQIKVDILKNMIYTHPSMAENFNTLFDLS